MKTNTKISQLEYKVYVAESEIIRSFPEAQVEAYPQDIRSPAAWGTAQDTDWVIDATDDDETRHFLSHRCAEGGLPLLSVGSGFVIRDGRIVAAGCRVNRAATGDACMACQVLDREPMEQAHASLVVPNAIAASLALDMLLRSVTGYMQDGDDEDTVIGEDDQQTNGRTNTMNFVLFDLVHRQLYNERVMPTPGCPWCQKLNQI